MNNEFVVDNIINVVNYLDKIVYMLKEYDNETREQDIAIQKLEEAIFWLTYGIEDEQ